MKPIATVATWLAVAPAWVGAFLVGAMMIIVTLDVVLKYAFTMPVPMTLEMVSIYFMPAICFLPLGNVTRTESHLEVELFTQALKGRALSLVKLFGCVFGLLYCAFLMDASIEQAIKMTQRGEFWEAAFVAFVVWPARWFLPIGVGLMMLWLALQSINHISIIATRNALLPEPEADHGLIPENDHE